MTTYYARAEYVYEGGDTVFGIPFSYIKKEYIKVYVDGELTENYTYLNDSQIRILDILEPEVKVEIVRETPIDEKFVVFSDTSILDKKVQNLAQDQVFEAVQELYDDNTAFKADTTEELASMDERIEDAEEIAQTTISTSEEAKEAADNAVEKAEKAEETAEAAENKATTAMTNSENALQQAGEAKTTADTAKDKVDEFGKDIEAVIEAAEKIQQLEGAVEEAKEAAIVSTGASEVAAQAAQEAQEAAALVANKQDKTDIALQTGDKTVVGAINELDATIKDIQLFKVPNVTITGEPTNESGQFSDFSENDYLQFPYVDITKGQPFVIDFCFTTGADITTQQNILDSYFGIALAIQNGKGIMALSSNGTGWDIGSVTGVYNIEPNTTYFAELSWDGTQYKTALSTDGEIFAEDMIANSTLSPYKTTIFIGASPNLFGAGTSHPFKGTINLNKCFLSINGEIEWQGMDDAGLKTRLDVDASNLSEIGKQNITRLTAIYQNELSAQNTIYLDETTSLYMADVTTATTFDFNVDNVDTTKTITFELKVTMATVQSITFPANVKWLDNEAPDLSSAGVYYFVFRTDDAGAKWFGNLQGRWGV